VTRLSRNQTLIEALAVELKSRRLELGWSQEDLAGASELDRPYISVMEVGKKQPTLSVLFKLAEALELTFEELAGRVERRYKREVRAQVRASRAE
jgi:transcriptional regulator with XRE-family HTH domain